MRHAVFQSWMVPVLIDTDHDDAIAATTSSSVKTLSQYHSTKGCTHCITTDPVLHKWFKFLEYDPDAAPGKFNRYLWFR